ncbi:MAG TPA: thiamine phosphate synthase [Terriglobales bacterium]|jgi:thiamine-phosphate pyrophosphorylase|nr:thiamine phosphate synthase [Terriglobales bacterium]
MADRCLLYYITDRSQFRGDERARRRALLDKVAEASCARVDYIQLREKDLSGRELETLARQAVEIVRQNSSTTRLLINSRVDVALATGADGVHLRAGDVTPSEVAGMLRAALPTPQTVGDVSFIIAASCHSDEEVTRAESQAVDFAVFAPVFGKSGARQAAPAGLAALRLACQAKIPILALGGVTMKNAASCVDAGAAGIAGIRLFQENRIEDVVRALRAG